MSQTQVVSENAMHALTQAVIDLTSVIETLISVTSGADAIEATDKTACKHGHLFSKQNTYYDKHGKRYCKTCRNERQARWRNKVNPNSGSVTTLTPTAPPDLSRHDYLVWSLVNNPELLAAKRSEGPRAAWVTDKLLAEVDQILATKDIEESNT